ncbi:hypothetical protein KSP39_PZI017277 [Platanthera zijinensis]|uniref:Uncharacterized protein n=1 Tax=Platanthera zijinensis TaxID=2320716 RepID=A0AAP0G032_9ASPA
MKRLELKHVPDTDQVADILTKALSSTLFYQCLSKLDGVQKQRWPRNKKTWIASQKRVIQASLRVPICLKEINFPKSVLNGIEAEASHADAALPSFDATWVGDWSFGTLHTARLLSATNRTEARDLFLSSSG